MRVQAITIVLGLAAVLPSAFPADSNSGRELHNENCIACHQSLMSGDANRMYTREDRRIKDYPSLVAQVRRCELNLGLQWFDDDVEDVASFLNEEFYKF